MDGSYYLNVSNYRLYDKDFGKARGRRLYCNTPTTDNAVQNLNLKPIVIPVLLHRDLQPRHRRGYEPGS